MEKLKDLWKKLNPKVALIGGAVVLSTSLGTCHFLGGETAPTEEVEEEAPEKPEKPTEEAPKEPATEE